MLYVNLKKKQVIKLPVAEAEFKINTADTKNLNEYTYYLLSVLKEEKTIDYIADIVKFKRNQIENELRSLEKYELVQNKGEDYTLTDIGYNVVYTIDEAKKFNLRNEKVLIDKYSEAILNYNDDLKVIEGKPHRFAKDKYKNISPVNSKSYFEKKYLDNFDYIDSEEIDIELKLGKEYWIEVEASCVRCLINKKDVKGIISVGNSIVSEIGEISMLDEILEECDKDRIRSLLCRGVVYKVKIDIRDKKLDKYRSMLENLNQLNKFDNELLSDKAIDILYRAIKEEKVQENITKYIYIDSISGVYTNENNFENSKVRGSVIDLTSNFSEYDIPSDEIANIIHNLEDEDLDEYTIEHKVVGKIEVVKEVPYKVLYGGTGLC